MRHELHVVLIHDRLLTAAYIRGAAARWRCIDRDVVDRPALLIDDDDLERRGGRLRGRSKRQQQRAEPQSGGPEEDLRAHAKRAANKRSPDVMSTVESHP